MGHLPVAVAAVAFVVAAAAVDAAGSNKNKKKCLLRQRRHPFFSFCLFLSPLFALPPFTLPLLVVVLCAFAFLPSGLDLALPPLSK